MWNPPCRRRLSRSTDIRAGMKWLGLIFTNMLRTQAVRRAVEPSREIFDGADVIALACRIESWIRFTKTGNSRQVSGASDASKMQSKLVTHNLSQPGGNDPFLTPGVASAAHRWTTAKSGDGRTDLESPTLNCKQSFNNFETTVLHPNSTCASPTFHTT
jgi:hypothetical protein